VLHLPHHATQPLCPMRALTRAHSYAYARRTMNFVNFRDFQGCGSPVGKRAASSLRQIARLARGWSVASG
jgi:hypothetical protein